MNKETIVITAPVELIVAASVLEDIRDWLAAEAERRKIRATFHATSAKPIGTTLYFSADLEGGGDPYDRSLILGALEDSWNEQEPSPAWQVLLMPTGK